jgi:hypothetical protein
MSNRAKYPSQSYGIGRVYMECQIKLNGAAVPTVLEGFEAIASVAHVGGTNVVTVTLKDSFPKLVAGAVDCRDDAGNGQYVTHGSVTGEGSSTVPTAPLAFKVQTFNASGSVQNDSTLVVTFALAIRDSNVTAGN